MNTLQFDGNSSSRDGVRKLRVAMVTNIPAPYRLPVYEIVAVDPEIEFKVFFCSGREPNREWNLATAKFEHVYLRESYVTFRGRFIHINPDILSELHRFRPQVIITTGFNPTHLLAYAYARRYGVNHIAMTDGTFQSEEKLSIVHRWVRRWIYRKTQVFIGASEGSFDLYRAYGVAPSRIFKSQLCANNAAFKHTSHNLVYRFDFIFCGRFVSLKNPLFALAVAQGVARKLGRRVSIAYVGSGELDEEIRTRAALSFPEVEATFPGFARQEELPIHYEAARVFLFPTIWEPWGIVANEACAAGLPILITPVAGAAHELVLDGENGFVLPLDLGLWVEAATLLLTDHQLYARFSTRSRELVREYNYHNAAKGIRNAAHTAAWHGRRQVMKVHRHLTHWRIGKRAIG